MEKNDGSSPKCNSPTNSIFRILDEPSSGECNNPHTRSRSLQNPSPPSAIRTRQIPTCPNANNTSDRYNSQNVNRTPGEFTQELLNVDIPSFFFRAPRGTNMNTCPNQSQDQPCPTQDEEVSDNRACNSNSDRLGQGFGKYMLAHSTPKDKVPSFRETFGSSIHEQQSPGPCKIPPEYFEPNISSMTSECCNRWGNSSSPQTDDIRYGMISSYCCEMKSKQKCKSKHSEDSDDMEESFMERFDRLVEKELERYRARTIADPTEENMNLSISIARGTTDPRSLDSVTSNVDIISRMKREQDTELTEAVEKLAKAEASVLFQGAIEAAEQAAASVPDEFAEEAAAAGAKAHTQLFHAEITHEVKEDVPGSKPIEVVGYVGITRPRAK